MCLANVTITADTLPATIAFSIAEGRATVLNLRATASEFSRSNPAIAARCVQAADVIDNLVNLLEPKR